MRMSDKTPASWNIGVEKAALRTRSAEVGLTTHQSQISGLGRSRKSLQGMFHRGVHPVRRDYRVFPGSWASAQPCPCYSYSPPF